MDHYKILGLNGEATIEEIKAAFRQLAIRWHPDKNLNNIEEAEEKFKLISEAYKVLIDPEKRKKYDLNEKQRSNWFSPSPSSPRSEEENCESSSSGKFSYTSFSDSLFASFFGKGAAFKAAPIEYPVSCTLEELYVGTIKNIVLTRDVLGARGKLKQAKEILTINIRPGLKNGAKFIFKEKGSEKPNTIPADIIVILHQKPHDLFTREGDDLIVSENISLLQVLTCSCGIDLKTLDSRNLMVPINCVSFPFHEKVIKGEGMPLANDPSKKGDLRIKLKARLF